MYLTQFLIDYFKSHTGRVAINMLFSLIIPVQDIVLPHFYGKLIDSLIKGEEILRKAALVIALFTLIELGFMLSDWHDIKTYATFQTFARQEILKNLMRQYERNFSDLHIGSLMSKLVKVPYTLVVWYERVKHVIIPYALMFACAVAYFSAYDKQLGLALLCATIAYSMIVIGVPGHFCRTHAVEKDKMVNNIHEEIDDTLRNFVAMHGDDEKQKAEMDRLEEYEELFTTRFASTMKCLMRTKMFTSLIIIVFTAFFILRSYELIKSKKLATAAFSSLFLVLIYISNSMMSLENQLREMIFDWGIITESDEMFNKGDVQGADGQGTGSDAIIKDIPATGIGMKNVSFAFPGATSPILKDISFHIEKGENVVILGDIGSGKSTILKLLLKFNEPTNGVVYLDGKPYNSWKLKDLKRKMGYVPQQPLLFNRSIIDNITYGTKGIARSKVEEFIKRVGVEAEFMNLEHGLDTKVGKNGSKLSGGQRQIVWCLRVFFQESSILILDEPTASLDVKSTETLKKLLSVMMKDKTVIVVTHDPGLLDLASRKIRVEGGKIIDNEKKDTTNTNILPKTRMNNQFVMTGGLLDN